MGLFNKMVEIVSSAYKVAFPPSPPSKLILPQNIEATASPVLFAWLDGAHCPIQANFSSISTDATGGCKASLTVTADCKHCGNATDDCRRMRRGGATELLATIEWHDRQTTVRAQGPMYRLSPTICPIEECLLPAAIDAFQLAAFGIGYKEPHIKGWITLYDSDLGLIACALKEDDVAKIEALRDGEDGGRQYFIETYPKVLLDPHAMFEKRAKAQGLSPADYQ